MMTEEGAAYTPFDVRLQMAATIGDRVRVWRLARGLSVGDLARQVGVSRYAIDKIERNETKDPKRQTLEGIARVLGRPLAELYGAEQYGDPEGETVDELIEQLAARSRDPRKTEEFLKVWWQLPEQVRNLMRLQAETYSELARGAHVPTAEEVEERVQKDLEEDPPAEEVGK